jgi:hypothetical protein
MKKSVLTLALACTIVPTLGSPAIAQTAADQRRFDNAQARYDRETDIFERERQLYDDARNRGNRGSRYNDRYDNRGSYGSRDPYATDYDASRYYRDDPRYRERQLSAQDEVYRGSDGRYYCKRNDGTTGLIVGAAGGGVLGNLLDGGRNRTAGTLVGGALGALLGRSVEQNQADIRCR